MFFLIILRTISLQETSTLPEAAIIVLVVAASLYDAQHDLFGMYKRSSQLELPYLIHSLDVDQSFRSIFFKYRYASTMHSSRRIRTIASFQSKAEEPMKNGYPMKKPVASISDQRT